MKLVVLISLLRKPMLIMFLQLLINSKLSSLHKGKNVIRNLGLLVKASHYLGDYLIRIVREIIMEGFPTLSQLTNLKCRPPGHTN